MNESLLEIAIREEAERKRLAEIRLAQLQALKEDQKRLDARVAEIISGTSGQLAPESPSKSGSIERIQAAPVRRGPPKNPLALQGLREVELLTVMIQEGAEPAKVQSLHKRLVEMGYTANFPTDEYEQVRTVGKRMQALKRKKFVEATNTDGVKSDYLWSVTELGKRALAHREKQLTTTNNE